MPYRDRSIKFVVQLQKADAEASGHYHPAQTTNGIVDKDFCTVHSFFFDIVNMSKGSKISLLVHVGKLALHLLRRPLNTQPLYTICHVLKADFLFLGLVRCGSTACGLNIWTTLVCRAPEDWHQEWIFSQ